MGFHLKGARLPLWLTVGAPSGDPPAEMNFAEVTNDHHLIPPKAACVNTDKLRTSP